MQLDIKTLSPEERRKLMLELEEIESRNGDRYEVRQSVGPDDWTLIDIGGSLPVMLVLAQNTAVRKPDETVTLIDRCANQILGTFKADPATCGKKMAVAIECDGKTIVAEVIVSMPADLSHWMYVNETMVLDTLASGQPRIYISRHGKRQAKLTPLSTQVAQVEQAGKPSAPGLRLVA